MKRIFLVSLIFISQFLYAQTYYIGDGGRGISLGILVPESEGLASAQAYLPLMVQGGLVSSISKYSAISVMDRVSLDRLIRETLDPMYEDNWDIIRLGHISHVGYMLTGKISRISNGYTLYFNISDTIEGKTKASYSGTCTVSQLDDHTAIQFAAKELMLQLGVQLTQSAISEL
jgi:hypothetical protein